MISTTQSAGTGWHRCQHIHYANRFEPAQLYFCVNPSFCTVQPVDPALSTWYNGQQHLACHATQLDTHQLLLHAYFALCLCSVFEHNVAAVTSRWNRCCRARIVLTYCTVQTQANTYRYNMPIPKILVYPVPFAVALGGVWLAGMLQSSIALTDWPVQQI